MIRGSKISPHQIFGPSSLGGHSQTFQRGEGMYQSGQGLGNMFAALFRKAMPMAGRMMKSIANNETVKAGGKQLLNSAADVAKNVAVDLISGEKPLQESMDENLQSARKAIADSIRNPNKRKVLENADKVSVKKIKRAKKKKVVTTKRKHRRRLKNYSIFQDE